MPRAGVGREVALAFAQLDLAADPPDGTGKQHELDLQVAELFLQQAHEAGGASWADTVRHAVAAALAEDRPEELRADVVRAAALLLGWLYCLDRRAALAQPLPSRSPRRLRLRGRRV